VIVGANHAGIAAANTILDADPSHEVVLFDTSDRTSYLGCGTALYVGKQVDSTDGMFYSSDVDLEAKGANVHLRTLVVDVDFDSQTVTARQLDGDTLEVTYDDLVFATGSSPITPAILGKHLRGVHTVKSFNSCTSIDQALDEEGVETVAVIGAGYIGVEMAEAVRRRGKNVLLFEHKDESLTSYFDPEFSSDIDEVLVEGGVVLHYGEDIQEIKGAEGRVTSLVTDKGEYVAQMVILAMGFQANTALARRHLNTGSGGAFEVNLKQETSKPHVYAIGDCATVYNGAKRCADYIPLATNAVRSGIIAGSNIVGKELESLGVQGSTGVSIWDYKMFSTGLTATGAAEMGMDVGVTDVEDLHKPAFMPDNGKVKLRVVYDKESRRILGAQIASRIDVSLGIHFFSLAITEGVTIDRLPLIDIIFMPQFNQAFNYITVAGLTAK
jgi:NADPH-dependent 2,4-dienoyl-CoA reductase/sulfur reductase-like enzyme